MVLHIFFCIKLVQVVRKKCKTKFTNDSYEFNNRVVNLNDAFTSLTLFGCLMLLLYNLSLLHVYENCIKLNKGLQLFFLFITDINQHCHCIIVKPEENSCI